MIGYWLLVLTNEIIEKSVTNKQTDRQTDRHIHESVYRVAPQLKSDKLLSQYASLSFLIIYVYITHTQNHLFVPPNCIKENQQLPASPSIASFQILPSCNPFSNPAPLFPDPRL